MELIYLYIEDYKSIKNQGFNFSPRFSCKYDGENLTIDENKEHINIFPNNVNITAIVGENGSGKSSVLNILYKGLIDFDFRGFALFSNRKQEIFYLSCSHTNYSFLEKNIKNYMMKIK